MHVLLGGTCISGVWGGQLLERMMDRHVKTLKGVGEKKAGLYQKLGVETLQDLLELYPRRYVNYNEAVPVGEAVIGETQAVRAELFQKQRPVRVPGGRTLYRATAFDGEDKLQIIYFNNPYGLAYANEGETYFFYGKVGGSQRVKEMISPSFIHEDDPNKLRPVYPMTAGLSSAAIAKDVKQTFKLVQPEITDPLPDELRSATKLCHYSFAVENIHFPKNSYDCELAKKRLAFEELLMTQLALTRLKNRIKVQSGMEQRAVDMEPFYESLPFRLTGDQRQAIEEGIGDLRSGYVMNRLVQGDVGSGKTMVAAALAYYAIQSGYQCAIMAPTELLAKQHIQTFTKIFDPLGLTCDLLTGSLPAKQRREAQARIETGAANFVVGTHALLSSGTLFQNLGLVITDEQHRFGVGQRAGLAGKGEHVHTLVMSATPIPRTLALILYGDLDISVIKELPPGRQVVDTLLIRSDKRERAFNFVRKTVDEGGQAYIVCPLVEEGEEATAGLQSVEHYWENLKKTELADYPVEILHGKMKAKEKDRVMTRFQANETAVLVATTVVEVGVDVPNALIMMVENAERFGLSQLHQLRGRVGRGEKKSYCILVSDTKGELAMKRLGIMVKTTDGFRLAEEDLKIRGPGDFFGNRQHGLPAFKIADMLSDSVLLKEANETARRILEEDPGLEKPENKGLAESVNRLFQRIDENSLN